ESLTDAYPTQRGPLPPVVFREPDTGKEKVAGREDSTSLYAKLGLSGSDTESDKEMPSEGRSGTQDEGQARSDPGTLDEGQAGADPGILDEGQAGSDPGTLNEGQAGSNPSTLDEGQARSNPDDIAESLPLPTLSVLVGPNLEHSDVEITDPSNFSFGDQFLNDKPSEADNKKTTVDTKAESMVSVTIQQDTSITPPMTSPVIDLVSRPHSPNVHWPLPTTTITTAATTTTTLLLPPQLQQGSSESLLIKRMGELVWDSIRHDESEDFDVDKAQEETKKKSKQDSPNTPPGSPPSPPPPPPPPSGASGASGNEVFKDFVLLCSCVSQKPKVILAWISTSAFSCITISALVLLEIGEIAKLAIYLEWGDSGEGGGCLTMGFCWVLQGKGKKMGM
ncbi:hypothetical protein Tco_0959565, partial [Tanacetum coccineum]